MPISTVPVAVTLAGASSLSVTLAAAPAATVDLAKKG